MVYAEQVSVNLKTFGFSVAGGLDVDGNEYVDMVVGAYDSDRKIFILFIKKNDYSNYKCDILFIQFSLKGKGKLKTFAKMVIWWIDRVLGAVSFKSRPVVYMDTAEIRYDVQLKEIDLENRSCNLDDGSPVPCVPLTVCFQYSGRGVDSRQEIHAQINLDAKNPKNPRLHFLSEGVEGKSTLNQTFNLVKGQFHFIVYLHLLVINLKLICYLFKKSLFIDWKLIFYSFKIHLLLIKLLIRNVLVINWKLISY